MVDNGELGLVRVLDSHRVSRSVWASRVCRGLRHHRPSELRQVQATPPRHALPGGWSAHNLCRLLPNNYLVNVAERDSEASRPVTNRLRGCRGVTIKESDAKKIQPSALKGILDMTDVTVDARANNSKELDQTSFPATWSIAFASNAPVEINTVGDTTGLGDKIVEIRPPFLFVATSEMTGDPRERTADEQLLNVKFFEEIFPEVIAFAMAAWPLIDRDVPISSIGPNAACTHGHSSGCHRR